jgi:hypothetical protein
VLHKRVEERRERKRSDWTCPNLLQNIKNWKGGKGREEKYSIEI